MTSITFTDLSVLLRKKDSKKDDEDEVYNGVVHFPLDSPSTEVAPVVAPSVSQPVYEPVDKPVSYPVVAPVVSPTRSDSAKKGAPSPPVYAPVDGKGTGKGTTMAPVATTSAPVVLTEAPVLAPTTTSAPVVLTETPVVAPTETPTVAPTVTPVTPDPSTSPTDAPTDVPTDAPTEAQVEAPVEAPVDAPVADPTDDPTSVPTKAPTRAPTSSPTRAPTRTPTDSPTDAPTDAPTEPPTEVPSQAPSTSFPTITPSNIPSEVPSSAPSLPVIVFVNEIGGGSSTGFVEVAYSTHLGIGIEQYFLWYYTKDGTVISSDSLPALNDTAVIGGLTLTFVEYDDLNDSTYGYVIAQKPDDKFIQFVSLESVITGQEGPAKGQDSVEYGSSERRILHDRRLANLTSISLSGDGCDPDAFVSIQTPATPGQLNDNQTFSNCPGYEEPSAFPSQIPSKVPSKVPSQAPSQLPSTQGLSTGAIVGIVVAVVVVLFSGIFLFRRSRSKRNNSNKPPETTVKGGTISRDLKLEEEGKRPELEVLTAGNSEANTPQNNSPATQTTDSAPEIEILQGQPTEWKTVTEVVAPMNDDGSTSTASISVKARTLAVAAVSQDTKSLTDKEKKKPNEWKTVGEIQSVQQNDDGSVSASSTSVRARTLAIATIKEDSKPPADKKKPGEWKNVGEITTPQQNDDGSASTTSTTVRARTLAVSNMTVPSAPEDTTPTITNQKPGAWKEIAQEVDDDGSASSSSSALRARTLMSRNF
mmetsp:Transcript_1020/g.1503  ORF Transcript_1020/g.1503 Transcript_1020/m.1503 type:complete len:756 (-) Transcript_1020:258-2525(-)